MAAQHYGAVVIGAGVPLATTLAIESHPKVRMVTRLVQ